MRKNRRPNDPFVTHGLGAFEALDNLVKYEGGSPRPKDPDPIPPPVTQRATEVEAARRTTLRGRARRGRFGIQETRNPQLATTGRFGAQQLSGTTGV